MLSSDGLIIAVDIGGTFTDITLADPAQSRVLRAKTPSTPHDPSEAFLTGLRKKGIVLLRETRTSGDTSWRIEG